MPITFKSLHYFFLASLSLLISGLLINPQTDIFHWFFLIWTTVTGIFITYRFNDFIDQDKDFTFHFKQFFKIKKHALVVGQFIFILFPLSLYYLSPFRIILLGIMLILGLLYSLKIQLKTKMLRPKHMFLVKNLLIGLCWGGLTLIGANNIEEKNAIALFIFTSLQVFIGSSIRDLNDIHADSLEYVHSIPVVLGVKRSIYLFHFLNLLSLFISILLLKYDPYIITMITAFIWRLFLLFKIKNNPQHIFWTQEMNLLTCSVILLGGLLSCLF